MTAAAELTLPCFPSAACAVGENANPLNVSAIAKRKAPKTNIINLLYIDIFLLKKYLQGIPNVLIATCIQIKNMALVPSVHLLAVSPVCLGTVRHRRNIPSSQAVQKRILETF